MLHGRYGRRSEEGCQDSLIAVGRLDVPELAEKVITEGKADLVAIGRGFLSDPHWARKVEEGRQKHIRPCVGCHDGCMGRLVVGKPTSCAVNPASGRERTMPSALQISRRK